MSDAIPEQGSVLSTRVRPKPSSYETLVTILARMFEKGRPRDFGGKKILEVFVDRRTLQEEICLAKEKYVGQGLLDGLWFDLNGESPYSEEINCSIQGLMMAGLLYSWSPIFNPYFMYEKDVQSLLKEYGPIFNENQNKILIEIGQSLQQKFSEMEKTR